MYDKQWGDLLMRPWELKQQNWMTWPTFTRNSKVTTSNWRNLHESWDPFTPRISVVILLTVNTILIILVWIGSANNPLIGILFIQVICLLDIASIDIIKSNSVLVTPESSRAKAKMILNPFTPTSDQDRISPYNINTISSR